MFITLAENGAKALLEVLTGLSGGCAEDVSFPAHVMGAYGEPAPHPNRTAPVQSLEFGEVWALRQVSL